MKLIAFIKNFFLHKPFPSFLVCRPCIQRDGLPGGLCSGHRGDSGYVMWPGRAGRPHGAYCVVQRRRRTCALQPDTVGPEDAPHYQCVVWRLRGLLVPARPEQRAAQQLHHQGDRWERGESVSKRQKLLSIWKLWVGASSHRFKCKSGRQIR